MNDSLASKLNQLKADDLLYFIFLVAIVIDIYADDQSRKELYGKNVRDPSALFILAAFLVLFVIVMFAIRNYREMQRFPPRLRRLPIGKDARNRKSVHRIRTVSGRFLSAEKRVHSARIGIKKLSSDSFSINFPFRLRSALLPTALQSGGRSARAISAPGLFY